MSKDNNPKEETFRFFVPVESLCKAGESGEVEKRWIQGLASTPATDLQGEEVHQKGIDYSYFLKYGYINDDHKKGPENKVGEPVECRLTPKGLWLKGFLYKNKERADYWWEHLNSLKTSGSSRKVGFSIEGKVLRRKGSKITKCWLQNVAITDSPVNVQTWAEIAKSLASQEWDEEPWEDMVEEKALTTSSGAAMIPESLEGVAKVTDTFKSLENLSFEDAVIYCQLHKGFSRDTSIAIVKSIFNKNGLLGD